MTTQNNESSNKLTDLHRSLMRALETVPYDTNLLSRSGMTVRQFRTDANALLAMVRGLQDACEAKTQGLPAPGTKMDRMRRVGRVDKASGSW